MANTSNSGLGTTIGVGILVTVVGTILATVALRQLRLQEPATQHVPAVVIKPATPPPRLVVPQFIREIARGPECHEFEEFLGQNRGKLVEIAVDVNTVFSSIYKDSTSGSLDFKSDAEADTSPMGERCSDFTCYITGDPYSLYWYKTGNHRLNGFFVIDRDVSWHQGQNFGLRAVPPETVLPHTQVELTETATQ